MRSVLKDARVLELNSSCQARDWRTVGEAMHLLCKGAVRAWDVDVRPNGEPVLSQQMTWEQWLLRAPRAGEPVVRAVPDPSSELEHRKLGLVSVPEIIVETRYVDHIDKKGLSLDLEGVFIRDKGICQYSHRRLTLDQSAHDDYVATIDHVIPRDPFNGNGPNTWDNVVLCARSINRMKANRTPEAAGLTLLRRPRFPSAVPKMMTLRNPYRLAAVRPFLPEYFDEAVVAFTD